MPDPAFDPRVYLAAERTLLAWLRTGVGVMAFGFVIARFGLFLRLLQAQVAGMGAPRGTTVEVDPASDLSSYLGAALVALGVLAVAGGAVQFQRLYRRLGVAARPSRFGPLLSLGLAWALAIVGVLLIATLLR